MKNDIDLINAYLNKSLPKSEIILFEKRLDNDFEFNLIYNEHSVFLEGVKRVELIEEINKAKYNYLKIKLLKYVSISIGSILILILLHNLFFKIEEAKVIEPANTIRNKTLNDSTKIIEKESVFSEEKEILKIKKEKVIKTLKKTTTNSSIESFYQSNRNESQIIFIDADIGAGLVYKGGTQLTISPKSFIYKGTDLWVKGKIKLEVTEFFNLSETSLVSISAIIGEKVSRTKGALLIRASKNGNELEIHKNNPINITLLNKNTIEANNPRIEKYTLNITKLGWINCNHFVSK